jgi:hypothetical protein
MPAAAATLVLQARWPAALHVHQELDDPPPLSNPPLSQLDELPPLDDPKSDEDPPPYVELDDEYSAARRADSADVHACSASSCASCASRWASNGSGRPAAIIAV